MNKMSSIFISRENPMIFMRWEDYSSERRQEKLSSVNISFDKL